jgi:thymidylate kinase
MIQDNAHSPERFFLKSFFEALESHLIPYAVLRNYETLPATSAGSDIDIIFLDDERAAINILLASAKLAGGTLLGSVQSPGFEQYAFLGRQPCDNNQWWGQVIDVSSSTYKGLPLANLASISKYVIRFNQISVLDARPAYANAFVKMYIARGILDEKYRDCYAASGGLPADEFLNVFCPLGRTCCSGIYKAISTQGLEVSTFRVFLSRFLFQSHTFCRNPISFTKRRLQFEASRVRRFIWPPGFVMAILGVDGAGKSTVINAILPALNAATHKAVVVQHLRPTLLPPLGRLKGRKNLRAGPVLEPHGSTPSGRLGSLFRLVYLTLDYLIGYWLWTRPKIAKQPTVVIFDRYAYDMALDPRRFRIGLSSRVAGWFAALAPKPDLIICLHGSPEVIAARKQELPLEETRRQVEALGEFASREARAVLISTDTSVEETRDRVLQTLCDFLQARSVKKL